MKLCHFCHSCIALERMYRIYDSSCCMVTRYSLWGLGKVSAIFYCNHWALAATSPFSMITRHRNINEKEYLFKFHHCRSILIPGANVILLTKWLWCDLKSCKRCPWQAIWYSRRSTDLMVVWLQFQSRSLFLSPSGGLGIHFTYLVFILPIHSISSSPKLMVKFQPFTSILKLIILSLLFNSQHMTKFSFNWKK